VLRGYSAGQELGIGASLPDDRAVDGSPSGEDDVGQAQGLFLPDDKLRSGILEGGEIVHHVVDQRGRLQGEGDFQRQRRIEPHNPLSRRRSDELRQLLYVVGHYVVEEADVPALVRDFEPGTGQSVGRAAVDPVGFDWTSRW